MSRGYPELVANVLQETSDAPLDVADRCDRCGARAKHRATLHAGELLFCEHHWREHREALADAVKVPRKL